MTDKDLIQGIKDALGTAEDGEALIEVARNAHRAEMVCAAIERTCAAQAVSLWTIAGVLEHIEQCVVEPDAEDDDPLGDWHGRNV